MASGSASSQWGPPIWRYLHLMTFLYPQTKPPTEAERARYSALFQAVAATLPCENCRKHFQEHVDSAAFRAALTSSEDLALAKWLVEVHNSVNKRLNKPMKTFAAVKQEYDVLCKNMQCGAAAAVNTGKSNVTPNPNTAMMIVCLSLVGLLCLWGLYQVFCK